MMAVPAAVAASVVCALAIGAALASALVSGNYNRIRTYLWAMLWHSLGTGAWCIFAQPEGELYFWLYAVVWTLPLLVAGVRVSQEAVQHVPPAVRRKIAGVSLAAGAIGFYFSLQPTRYSVLTALIGGVMATLGLRVRISAFWMQEFGSTELHGGLPYRTLGLLWILESFLFWLYAAGVPLYPQEWHALGEWTFAALISPFMLKLMYDFFSATSIPLRARN